MAQKSVYCNAFGGIDCHAKNFAFAADTLGFSIDEAGTMCKYRGKETFYTAESDIVAVWSGVLGGRKAIICAANGKLCDTDPDTSITSVQSLSGASRAALFKFEDKLYALCDTGYFRYDGTTIAEVDGYVPLISVATTPAGSGTPYEAVNMLTAARRQLFSPDGEAACFQLAEKGITGVTKVTFNGSVVDPGDYNVDYDDGTVTLTGAPFASVNTLEIEYVSDTSARAEFLGYKNAMLFGSDADERVFLWNNAQKPNYRIHSELADGVPCAEYFPVTSYTAVGSAPITDIVQEYDKQLIFTADSAYYSYCEMKTSLSGQVYASYPVYPLHPRKGNLIYGSGCTCNGMPVTLCADGLNLWQPTTVETEKNAFCISSPVRDLLAPETWGLYSGAKICTLDPESEIYVLCSACTLVYNYRSKRWYKLNESGLTSIFASFGSIYTVKGNKIYKATSVRRDGDAYYKTHYTDLGSTSLKDICFIELTLEAGYLTAGSVVVSWPGDTAAHSEEKEFTVPATQNGNVYTLALPFFIPSVSGITVEFKCPSGKELKLLGFGITYDDKGVHNGL